MSRRGLGVAIAVVALATAIATAGAVVNLQLLEPHRPDQAPMVLGATIERTSTTTAPTPTSDAGASTTSAPPRVEPVPTTAPTTTSTTSAWRRSYAVGEAGAVTLVVRGGVLDVESVVPHAGWVYAVEEQHDDEVEITFRRTGHEDESTFHASLHGSELRVEIEPAEGESPDD